MCVDKDEAGTKIDRLIATMERLAQAVEASNAGKSSDVRVSFDGDFEPCPTTQVTKTHWDDPVK